MNTLTGQCPRLLAGLVDHINVGLFVLDSDFRVRLWNRFMELNSGRSADEVLGEVVFDVFPELDEPWLRKKVETVFEIGGNAFTAANQRPYLLRFDHHRPITGGIDFMRQDCTFLPLQDEHGGISHVGVSIVDVTDKIISEVQCEDALERLGEMSIRDGLTGIFNRRQLERSLEAEVSRVRRYGGALSVAMFDIDHFKRINDGYGHRAGDEVIQTVVDHTCQVLRQPDIAGRYGGDEFTLILPETGLDGASVVSERLRRTIEDATIRIGGQAIHVTISVGVSVYRAAVANHEALLDEADQALYQAKTAGRNQVVTFQPARMDDQAS